jgi:hypothetical protein
MSPGLCEKLRTALPPLYTLHGHKLRFSIVNSTDRKMGFGFENIEKAQSMTVVGIVGMIKEL